MKRASVLVVDDDRPIVRLLELVLNHNGFQTAIADDGVAALDIFGSLNPDAVILDLNLPKKPGWEVYHEIKAQRSIPIFVITGNVLLGDQIQRVLELNDGYFAKPFDVMDLVAHLRDALTSQPDCSSISSS